MNKDMVVNKTADLIRTAWRKIIASALYYWKGNYTCVSLFAHLRSKYVDLENWKSQLLGKWYFFILSTLHNFHPFKGYKTCVVSPIKPVAELRYMYIFPQSLCTCFMWIWLMLLGYWSNWNIKHPIPVIIKLDLTHSMPYAHLDLRSCKYACFVVLWIV